MVVARCPFSSSPTREMNPGLGSRSSRSGLSSAWFCAAIYAGIQMSHTRITEHPWRLRLFESWSKEASQSSPAVQTGSGPVCQARVKFKFMPVRADRSRLYGASASTQTGLPDARRGRPLPPRAEPLLGGFFEASREASADTSDTDAVPTDAEIVAALRRKAEKGDAAAARELREWRAVESTAVEDDGWLELLTRQERRIVRRIIDRALARDGSP
jgi:hypothetical protein